MSLLQLPAAIKTSLYPASEHEAGRIEAQLDVVAEGIRLFDYAYPVVATILVPIELHHGPAVPVILSWLAILATSLANELLLARGAGPGRGAIAHTRHRARKIAAMTLVQTAVWVSLSFWVWDPAQTITNMYGVIIVSCTLAGISVRFAPHAASAAGPMALLSLLMIVMESIHGSTRIMAFFQLTLVYTTLMLLQACAIHRRFNNTWRLERDRELLIDTLRKAKAESDRARELALAASKAKSEFLANMSHELRTPLNAIIGFSDIVKSKTFGNAVERYCEYGGFINQSGHHLLALIGDILELAKIESGRKVLQRQPVDLRSLVLDETRIASETAAAKGVRVVPELPSNLPLLRADLHAVRQILANLLSNAVKFTPPNGSVGISVALNAGRELEIRVSDTGVGIAPEDRAHLFERVGHGRPEITNSERGSGLGLPIVKGLVEMHRGRIRLESELGEGTSITVIFPGDSILDSPGLRVA